MKKLFAFMLVLMSLLSVYCCDKAGDDKNGGEEILNNSSWSKAVEEHPFLSNFPEFGYDFRGTYNETPGGESYVIAVWNIEEKVASGYKDQLKASGFTADSDNAIFKKTVGENEYICGVSFGGSMLGITYSVGKAR